MQAQVFSRLKKLSYLFAVSLFMLLIAGCGTLYVDGGLPEVPSDKFKVAARPHPVQLLYEFQTKGAVNSVAAEQTRAIALEAVKRTGLFSEISTAPVTDGAVLSIIINNVPLTDDAAAKGFVTGLTFGVVGNQVTDGYLCTVEYLPSAKAPKITKTVRHAIHTTVGAKGAPEKSIPAASARDAVEMMVRQAVSNLLDAVASDAAFKG
ncbi:hypothetical protein [Noviherbaspirillum pedocola]|uniref:hypothetical protein n=1 Tax=Noviherbaspirillum pedocola TaxID=2801341 RepID=UPI001F417EFF|nr:hypothetical protein [Noviherbaspirillum pedocola]